MHTCEGRSDRECTSVSSHICDVVPGGSPVDFACLVPAPVLPIGSVISVLALEVNSKQQEEKNKHEREWPIKLRRISACCLHTMRLCSLELICGACQKTKKKKG